MILHHTLSTARLWLTELSDDTASTTLPPEHFTAGMGSLHVLKQLLY